MSNRYLFDPRVISSMRLPATGLVVFMLLWGCGASQDVLGPQSEDVTGVRETPPDPPPPDPEIIRFPNGNIELEGTLELQGIHDQAVPGRESRHDQHSHRYAHCVQAIHRELVEKCSTRPPVRD